MAKERLINADERYHKANILLIEGELEEALEYSRQLLADDDENHKYWTLEGEIRLALDEIPAAERAFDRACSIAPGNAGPLLHKSRFLIMSGRFEEAQKLGAKALEFTDNDDDRKDIYLIQAESYLYQVQMEINEIDFDELDELEEHDHGHGHDDHFMNASISVADLIPLTPEMENSLALGLELCKKSLNLNDNNPEAWFLQSFAQTQLQLIDEAIDSLQHAVELDPEQAEYWNALGISLQIQGDDEAAQEAFLHLFDLETAPTAEGMEFSRAEFQKIAQEAIETMESEILEEYELQLPPIFVSTEDFPSREVLESLSEGEVFNPWDYPFSLEHEEGQEDEEDTLNLILYQRNIEREVDTEDPEELGYYIYHLIGSLLNDILFDEDDHDIIDA